MKEATGESFPRPGQIVFGGPDDLGRPHTPKSPDGLPVMLGHVESPAREVTLDFLGFEKRIFVSADTRRLRIPVFLGPHFPGVEYIEFEQDEDDENLFRLSHVHRTGDCPACAKPDTGTD